MTDGTPPRKRLESWKQIADYLGCCERTAHRYEAQGIPVYRVGARQRHRVFAYAAELDHWLHEGGPGPALKEPQEPDSSEEASAGVVAPAPKPGKRRLRMDIADGPDSSAVFF